MREKRIISFFLMLFSVTFLFAESLDKVWIIRKDTGSAETMVRLQTPDLAPDQTIEVYIEKKGLSTRWGEGFATYTYTYYSEQGKEIWSSSKFSKKLRAPHDTWTLSHVHRITLPENMPDGVYHLGFEVSDYHTKKVYKGNVDFSVGKSGGQEPATETRTAEAQQQAVSPSQYEDFFTRIGNIELQLVSVEKTDNRLTFSFRAINTGDSEEELRLYPYDTRIVSRQGDEFGFSKYGGGGTLSSGMRLAPGVPMKATLYFKRPVPSRVDHVALLDMPFYYRDDKIAWKNIPVP